MESPFSLWFNYDFHANDKMLNTMLENKENIPDDAIKLFSHIIAAQEMWNSRMQQRKNHLGVWERIEIDGMAAELTRNLQNTMMILEEISLKTEFVYSNTSGKTFSNSVEDILFHLLTHAMYHRGQIAKNLKSSGIEPPDTAYISFRR